MKARRTSILLLLTWSLFFALNHTIPATQEPYTEAKTRAVQSYGKLPLSFEHNEGQVDEKVKFLARWGGRVYWFIKKEVILDFPENESPEKVASLKPSALPEKQRTRHTVRISFPGSNTAVQVEGLERQSGRINYFIGDDKSKWRTNVPIYRGVIYRNLWDSIDLRYEGRGGNLKYEFVVAPGADPDVICLAFKGIDDLRISDAGELVVTTKLGDLIEAQPIIYQVDNGKKKEIKGAYRIIEGGQVGFSIENYDALLPLIIDPLVYSTYLGGNSQDYGMDIVVDDIGNAYVTGWTQSTNFPIDSPYQASFGGGNRDIFVTKFNASGSALIYSTYIGGDGRDEGRGIALDGSGNAYITGDMGGEGSAFAAKLDSTGSTLIYSIPIGSSRYGRAIAVDELGNAYVTGWTVGGGSAFVTMINASGADLVYSTFLGGDGLDFGYDIAVDSSGNVYVTGDTTSSNFPIKNSYQSANAGGADAFVTKLSPPSASGPSLVYSTYLGGTGNIDRGYGIAVDGSGNAYVAGYTYSMDFPTTATSFQATFGGGTFDAFVTKLNGTGIVEYSTYLGGSDVDAGLGLALDEFGNAYIAGWTKSIDFPTYLPDQEANAGDDDVFVAKLNALGSEVLYSTYLGGSYIDGSSQKVAIAVDRFRNIYVTGHTGSTDFPTASPYQEVKASGNDAFVTKILIGRSLSGEVIDDNTGNGIADASVIASGPDDYSTTTDENGNFNISDMTPGEYTVTASCNGCQCEPAYVNVPEGGTASVTIQCIQSAQPCILDMSSAQASFGCDSWGIPCLTIHNIGFFGQQFVVNWKMNLINGDWGIQGLGEGITNGIGILDFTEVQCNFSECVSMAIHNIQIFEQDYSLEWQLNMQTGDWEFAGIIMGTGAETTYGTIAGRVTRNSYGLGGITVTATYGIDTYASTTSRGNVFNPSTAGEYTLSVPVGTYEVRFSGSWYQTLCISNVTVTDNETVTLDVTIQRGSSSAECVPYSEYTGGTEGI